VKRVVISRVRLFVSSLGQQYRRKLKRVFLKASQGLLIILNMQSEAYVRSCCGSVKLDVQG